MENENKQYKKRLLVFCSAFPQDLPVEIKQTLTQLFNSTITSIDRLTKQSELNSWNMFAEGHVFRFQERENSYDIFNTFQYIMHQHQQGKDPSIAYGVPHHGFDLIFVEVESIFEQDTIRIMDSYLIQNAFITSINSNNDITDVSLKGFYAQNPAIMELAKNILEQNILSARNARQTTELEAA